MDARAHGLFATKKNRIRLKYCNGVQWVSTLLDKSCDFDLSFAPLLGSAHDPFPDDRRAHYLPFLLIELNDICLITFRGLLDCFGLSI